MIYLSKVKEAYQAVIVIYSCEPNADTTKAEGIAELYEGIGVTIDAALDDATTKQNRKPFYAQNELLLIGADLAKQNITPVLEYFSREEALRPNMAIFIVDESEQAVAKVEENADDMVKSLEYLLTSKTEQINYTTRVYECDIAQGTFNGILPVVTLEKETAKAKISGLTLYNKGVLSGAIAKDFTPLAMVLNGKARKIHMSEQLPEDVFVDCDVENISLRYTVDKNMKLQVKVCGDVENLVLNQPLQNTTTDSEKKAVEELKQIMQKDAAEIVKFVYDENGLDGFSYLWWIRCYSLEKSKEMERLGKLYTSDNIQVLFNLNFGL
ncbi:MAG: hypothetical protein PHG02_07955 [Oscillospiraceae bacterium]|nr:hypothetical protein [Oscillospiraceae bacterium]